MKRQSNPFLVSRAQDLRRTSSTAEQLLWTRISKRQLRGYRFRRRPIVEGKIPDFGCSEARLVIEIDGSVDPTKEQRDAARDEYLAKKAIRTLHLPANLIAEDLEEAVRRITAWIPQAPSTTGRAGRGAK